MNLLFDLALAKKIGLKSPARQSAKTGFLTKSPSVMCDALNKDSYT